MANSRVSIGTDGPSFCRSPRLFVWVALLFGSWLADGAAHAEDWHYRGVDRVVAVSDVHGAYDAFVATLQAADILDEDLSWSGDETHLVITGDLLDRGPESRRAMDLVMRLESEAREAGGRVHQLLGNHEVMNLIGDLRYVSEEEYASYQDLESAKEREHWYRQFRQSMPDDIDDGELESIFATVAPPGFFGHRRAFQADGKYGRWLLAKPFAIVVNETAFVHGGAPPFVAEQGLAGINEGLKQDLADYLSVRAKLSKLTGLSPTARFKEIPSLLIKRLESGGLRGQSAKLAEELIDLSRSPLHSPTGPTWYRGTVRCSSLVESDPLNAALGRIGATRIVVGHTPTASRQVQQRMDGRVIEIDTGMLASHYQGSGHVVVLDSRGVSAVNQAGKDEVPVVNHASQVGDGDRERTERRLEEILKNGAIDNVVASGTTWKVVKIVHSDEEVVGFFRSGADGDAFAPEVAAFRLDRLLGLGMVPVAVRREIAGQIGTLQLVSDDTINEQNRALRVGAESTHCDLNRQKRAMLIFDILINNPARSPLTMLYQDGDWRLILVDHSMAFGAKMAPNVKLDVFEEGIEEQWRKALEMLDERTLTESLQNVLDEKRLAALSVRRDALLAIEANP